MKHANKPDSIWSSTIKAEWSNRPRILTFEDCKAILAHPGTRDAVRVILKANAKRDSLDAVRDVLLAADILTSRLEEFDRQGDSGNPKLGAVAAKWRKLLGGN